MLPTSEPTGDQRGAKWMASHPSPLLPYNLAFFSVLSGSSYPSIFQVLKFCCSCLSCSLYSRCHPPPLLLIILF